MEKPNVIYIMGIGRSGSSITDIILGNSNNSISLGELNRIFLPQRKNAICSCGKDKNGCPLWKNFFLKFPNSYTQKEIENFSKLENHKNFKTLLKIFSPKRSFQNYYSYLFNQFEIIKKITGNKTFIDSSKSPLRALHLLSNDKLNVKIIHLVRDIRGVFNSFLKKNVSDQRGVLGNFINWSVVNFLCILICLKYGPNRVLRVKYEDIIFNNERTLTEISDFTGLNVDLAKYKIKNKINLERGHILSANRVVRQKKPLHLRSDIKWIKKLNNIAYFSLTFLCFPLLCYLKYPISRRRYLAQITKKN